MGHSSVVVTERYSHLKPDLFRESVYTTMAVDLAAPKGEVVPIVAPKQRVVAEAPAQVLEALATA